MPKSSFGYTIVNDRFEYCLLKLLFLSFTVYKLELLYKISVGILPSIRKKI